MFSLSQILKHGRAATNTHHCRKITLSCTLDSDNHVYANNGRAEKFRVVICGGGALGSAIAYNLAKRGWGPHTIVVESKTIGNNPIWHSSDLVGMFKPTWSQIKLAQTSIRLWKEFEAQGLQTGWKQCGSLLVARNRDRMIQYRRMKSQSVAWNIPCEIVSPEQCKELCPLIEISDLLGGLWIPGDGVADSEKISKTLISEGKKLGLNVVENCEVLGIKSENGKVSLIETSQGDIITDYFVNAAGFWARHLGQISNPPVKVPLYAAEHYYLHTKPIEGIDPMTPVMRDPDGHIYIRENGGRLLAGGFEKHAKPLDYEVKISNKQADRRLPEDWDHFHTLLEQILHRMPMLNDISLEELYNGPETFSPDCKWIIGEAPEVSNYLVVAGMKTIGISAAGGVGQAIADIIIDGFTKFDMYELDISRFLGLHNNRKFLRDRVREVPGLHYLIPYPHHEFETGRNLRMSPIYPALREAGAVFGQIMGYERPTWFDLESSGPQSPKPFRIATTKTFAKPHWFDFVEKEYNACREAVGLCDYSSFTKIDLWSKGREVVDYLQYLCSNDVDVPVGSVIHTGMQNVYGGYENDCSLTRLSEYRYMMIAPTIQQTRCKVWMDRRLPPDGSVNVSDVTSMYTAICLMGPFTRVLLSELTDTDLSPANFPFFTYKEINVGLANGIRALNLTHTGELGYVLYIPNEFALHVYSRVTEVGEKYGLKHVGYYAMRALRVEKFYAFWGQDLDTLTTPLECGRTWRVKFNKPYDFIGKDALLKQKSEGIKRQYVQLLLTDHDPETDLWSWGGEPIYRNGVFCGQTTTTSYGFTFKKLVCLGFVQNIDENGNKLPVKNDYVLSGDYEVDIAGMRYNAKVHLHSPNLPTKYPDQERESYKATRDKPDESSLLTS